MIGLIENAIVALLQNPKTVQALGYSFASVTTFPENWKEYAKAELLHLSPPFAFVTFAGWTPIASTDYKTQVNANYGVIVGTRNYRSNRDARHGSFGDVGTFQLIQDVARLLQGNDLGLAITGFEIGTCQTIDPSPEIEKAGLNLMALQLKTEFIIEKLSIFNGDLNDFQTANLTWDAPPPNQTNPINQTITLETGA